MGRPWTAGESGEVIGVHTRQGERRTTAETSPRSRAGPGVSNDPARSWSEGRGEAVDGGRVDGWPNGPFGRGKPRGEVEGNGSSVWALKAWGMFGKKKIKKRFRQHRRPQHLKAHLRRT